MVIEQLNS